MKALGNILVFAIIVVASFLTSLLGAHVVLSIAEQYSLTFISAFSFAQIYGLFCVIGLVAYVDKTRTKKQKEQSLTQSYKEAFNKVFTKALFYLVTWGVAYVAFGILN